MQFNFGPIARTDASGTHDTFNLASLPLHVTLDALMAATNRDEFVAWCWCSIGSWGVLSGISPSCRAHRAFVRGQCGTL